MPEIVKLQIAAPAEPIPEGIVEILRQIYKEVAPVACKGLCQRECTNVPIYPLESHLLTQRHGAVVELGQHRATFMPTLGRNGACQFLDEAGRCSVYEDRPLVCRVFGHDVKSADEDLAHWLHNSLHCEHDCSPNPAMSEKQFIFLNAALTALSSGRTFTAEEFHQVLEQHIVEQKLLGLTEDGEAFPVEAKWEFDQPMNTPAPNPLRPELPTPPARIARLPVDERGYPVPFFVCWVKDGRAVPPGQGTPDHRIMDISKLPRAIKEHLCWICGERLGKYSTYSIGPMCALNRTIAEPPSHLECARYSALACPFMSRPHARRRDAGKPGNYTEGAGIALQRNPGVMLLWTTTAPVAPYRVKGRTDDGIVSNSGILFDLPEPEAVEAWAEGRPATWEEVAESIRTGLPHLEEVAQKEGPAAVAALQKKSEERTAQLQAMLARAAAA